MDLFDRFLALDGIELGRFVLGNLENFNPQDFSKHFDAVEGDIDAVHLESGLMVVARARDSHAENIIARYLDHPTLYVRVRAGNELASFPILSDTTIERAISAALKESSNVGPFIYLDLLRSAGPERLARLAGSRRSDLFERFGGVLAISGCCDDPGARGGSSP